MFVYGISALQPLAAELTIGEKGVSATKVILTGFAVVFAVLFFLIGIIKLYSLIVGKLQSTGNKRSLKPTSREEKLPVMVREPALEETESDDGVNEEVVAVIAAAVAALYGSKNKVKIKSIRKSGGRSAWADAGVRDNTRPF